MVVSPVIDRIIRDLENTIDSADFSPEHVSTGEVVYLGDGIAKVIGLRDIAYNEIVTFDSGAMGVAMNLEEHFVGVVVLKDFGTIQE